LAQRQQRLLYTQVLSGVRVPHRPPILERKGVVMEKLNIDIKIYEALGMTILTKEDVAGRRLPPAVEIWPKDYLFNPSGISLEEANEVMRKML
jgi:hypothetical protein